MQDLGPDACHALFESVPDGLLLVDDRHRIVEANAQAHALFGYAPGALFNRPLSDLVPVEARHAHADAVAGYLHRPVARSMGRRAGLRGLRADGSTFPVEIALGRLPFGDGSLTVASVRDITAVEALWANLAEAERHACVARLAEGVAHEINNPLTYLAINLELVLRALRAGASGDEALGATRLGELACVLAEAQHGAHLVAQITRDLHTLGAPDRPELTAVDLGKCAASAVRLCGVALRRAATLVGPTGDATARASEPRVIQLLLNLLTNAIRAVEDQPRESARIEVRLGDAEAGVFVEVADNGRGMDEHVLARAFQPGFTTRANRVGSGLGLSIAQRQARAMGGDISARSELGVGSVFRVTLPCGSAN